MILGGAQENALLIAEGLNKLKEYPVTLASGVDKGPEGELLSRVNECAPLIIVPELGRNISVSDIISRKALASGIGHPEKFSTIYSGMELD